MSDERRIISDVMSDARFIGWLATQPSDDTYCYGDHGRCLLAQYFAAQGFQKVEIYSGGTMTVDGKEHRYPVMWDVVACCCDRTFGDALRRARELD